MRTRARIERELARWMTHETPAAYGCVEVPEVVSPEDWAAFAEGELAAACPISDEN